MKITILAMALVILAGCAEIQQQSAAGGSAPGYSRQFNNGYPYDSPYGM